MPAKWKVCIVGAGGISAWHLMALKSLPSVRVTAVVDPHLASAQRLARACGAEGAYRDPGEVFERKLSNVAHILVPPALHKDVALPYIRAGNHVFIEKPMCLSAAEAAALEEAARSHGVMIGVNHNLCFTPAHLETKEIVASNRLGKIHHLYYYWNADLPLLSRRKYGHWMFESPRNIFFEQAPHPLSQIYDLVGAMLSCRVLATSPSRLAPGIDFIDTWQVSMICERATAQLFYSIGQEFQASGMLIICENGAITASTMRNRVIVETSPKGFNFANYRAALGVSRQAGRQAHHNLFEEIRAKLGLRPSADAYITSMRDSIRGFYEGLEKGKVPVDAEFGAEVVSMCELVTETVEAAGPSAVTKPATRTERAGPKQQTQPADVAIFGGTGLIGRHVVARLVDAGMRVNVMARGADGLPAVFSHELVRCSPGNIVDPEDVEGVIGDAQYVIDLAFAIGDSTWDYMEQVGIGGARNVAECCLRKKVKRLIYTSTINVLDISNPRRTIGDSTGCDPRFQARSLYPRMKATCEHMLMDMHRRAGLKVVILRPGIVIGEDNYPYHGGVARFFNKQNAECPSKGTHPLPFVLVKDVAEAFYLALTKPGIDGKSYNLVGDVRLTAREYIAELSRVLNRPIEFIAVPSWKAKTEEVIKWALKRATGRSSAFPNFREIGCWGLYGRFDNSEIKRDLGWRPVADRAFFIREGIEVQRKARG